MGKGAGQKAWKYAAIGTGVKRRKGAKAQRQEGTEEQGRRGVREQGYTVKKACMPFLYVILKR